MFILQSSQEKGFVMLSYFFVQNFKSILDLKLDLGFAEGKAPNHYEELQILPFVGDNYRHVPVLGLYGANASGKTNILQALHVFKQVMFLGAENRYFPNKLNPKYDSTTFEIGFYENNSLYIYGITYNRDGISHEVLYKKDKNNVIFEIKNMDCTFSNIATKEYTSQRLEEIFRVECINDRQQQRMAFLTRVARGYIGLNKELVSVWTRLFGGFEVYPENNVPLPYVLERMAGGNNPEKIVDAFDRITTILRKLDIDINRLTWDRKFQPIEDPAKPLDIRDDEITFFKPINNMLIKDNIRSYHTDINGNEVVFNFNEESEGTITLASLLGLCLNALDKGIVLCVDELDKSLHSRLLIEVVRMFKDKRYNQKNAQLIFTAHNTDVLDDDLMRVSEVGFVNKAEKTGSTMKRISDFDGKRNVNNFRKQYLDGLFSGVPYPYI